MKRIGEKQLGEIELRLTEQDRKILLSLRELRYLKTNQLQRLFFSNVSRTNRTALTAATRTLNRLKALGLISHLEKRIGGVRAGSLGMVWHITEVGCRLLDLGLSQERKRNRQFEPSPMFLRHTLAVSLGNKMYINVIYPGISFAGNLLIQPNSSISSVSISSGSIWQALSGFLAFFQSLSLYFFPE